MQKKTKKNSRSYILIAVAVILFGISTAIFLSLPIVTDQQNNTTKNNSANQIKLEALKIINSDSKKAKELFQQALSIYQSSKDTNNIVDTESLIYLIDHKE